MTDLPTVPNWKSEGTKATAERRAFFQALPGAFVVPRWRDPIAPIQVRPSPG